MAKATNAAAEPGLTDKQVGRWLKDLRPVGVTRRDGSIVVADVDIPREVCAAILRWRNANNIRPHSRLAIEHIRHDMASGEWSTCYDPIAFRPDGSLSNGQTRLAAGSHLDGVPAAVVILNAIDDSRRATDAGRKRTILQTHGLDPMHASMSQVVLNLERRTVKSNSRAKLAARYHQHQEIFDNYSALFRSRPVLKDAYIAAAFAFAECYRESEHERLRMLAEDMTMGQQGMRIGKKIADHIVRRKRDGQRAGGQWERLSEAKKILRALQTYLCNGEDATIDIEGDVDWWMTGGAAN